MDLDGGLSNSEFDSETIGLDETGELIEREIRIGLDDTGELIGRESEPQATISLVEQSTQSSSLVRSENDVIICPSQSASASGFHLVPDPDQMISSQAFANVGSYLYYQEIRQSKGTQTECPKILQSRFRWGRFVALVMTMSALVAFGVQFYREAGMYKQMYLEQQLALEQAKAEQQVLLLKLSFKRKVSLYVLLLESEVPSIVPYAQNSSSTASFESYQGVGRKMNWSQLMKLEENQSAGAVAPWWQPTFHLPDIVLGGALGAGAVAAAVAVSAAEALGGAAGGAVAALGAAAAGGGAAVGEAWEGLAGAAGLVARGGAEAAAAAAADGHPLGLLAAGAGAAVAAAGALGAGVGCLLDFVIEETINFSAGWDAAVRAGVAKGWDRHAAAVGALGAGLQAALGNMLDIGKGLLTGTTAFGADTIGKVADVLSES